MHLAYRAERFRLGGDWKGDIDGSRLVAVLDHVDDELGLVEAPCDEGFEEVELEAVSETAATRRRKYARGPQAPCC